MQRIQERVGERGIAPGERVPLRAIDFPEGVEDPQGLGHRAIYNRPP